MTPELEALAQRLEEVEKQLAHLVSLVTEQTDTDRTVEARKFVVRDEQGQRRVELGTVTNRGDKDEAIFGPWLGLFEANEQLRACIGVGGRIKGPWLELYNEKGNVAVEISVGDDGAEVRLFDAKGKALIALAATEDGPVIAILNPSGNPDLGITASSSHTSLCIGGADGPSLKLVVDRNGPCLVFGKDNKVFWSAP